MADLASTTDPAVDPQTRADMERYMRRRRRSSNAFITVIAAVFVAGVLNLTGVESTTTSNTADGVTLAVHHSSIARAGLATPFTITVSRPGGFTEPVIVAIDSDYLAMLDQNAQSPQPTAETTIRDRVVMEFEPPPIGDDLLIRFDARVEPARQLGARGHVAVLDARYRSIVDVEFRTRLWS